MTTDATPRDWTACKDGRRHKWLPDSGWCAHGCGNRDDGRTVLPGGKPIRHGREYSPDDLADLYQKHQQLTDRSHTA